MTNYNSKLCNANRRVTRGHFTSVSVAALSSAAFSVGSPTSAYADSPLCVSTSTNATIEWVTRVGIDGVDINIAPNTNYFDGSNTSLSSVAAGESFDIEVDVVTNGPVYNEFVIAWLDLNQDGVIDDASERVFVQNANVDGSGLTFSGSSVAVPNTAFNGTTYGRVIMQFAANPNLCGTYEYGTTVDFRMDVEGGADNPNAPQPPASVVAVAGNGNAALTITPPATGNTPTEYLVTVQPDGTEVTVDAADIGNPVVIPGLTNDQAYTFEVTSVFDYTTPGGAVVPLSSSSTTSNAVTPDGTAPAAPTGIDLTDASNSGSNDDTITSDVTPSIAGTAEPGSEVEVFVGGVSVGTVTADPGTGAWEFPFADGDLASGDNAVTTTATDAAGNTSPASSPLTVTIDTANAAPSGLELTDATNSGSTDDTLTNIAAAEVTGTTEANAEVEVFVAGVSVGTTTADGDGNWSFTFADGDLSDGDNAVTAVSTDLAGNVSPSSDTLTITLDETAPLVPSSLALTDATNSGITTDTITNVATAEVTGTTEANAEVEVFVAGISVGTTTADGDGNWSFTFTDGDLATGDNAVTATSTDAAGTTSNPSSPFTITLDDSAPAAPSGIDLTDATNSGSNDDTLTNDTTSSIAGTAEPGAEVEVFVDGVSAGTVSADPTTGAWEFSFADSDLAEGDNVITTQATDVAGNTSPSSAPITVTIDTANAAPSGLALTDATNSGSTDDNLTNVAAAEVVGLAEANAEVEVFVAGVSAGTTTADADGNWSFTFADGDLATGDNAVTAVSTDTADNISTSSETLTITLDANVPAAPSGIDLTDATNSGSNGDTTTSNPTPSIAGSAEPGATVEVIVGGISVGTVVADGTTGAWEFPFADGDLAEGDNAITTSATDAAGNTSPATAPLNVTIDTGISVPSGIDLTDATNSGSNDDTVTSDTTPSVAGTAEPGSEVEVFVGAVSVGTVTANATTGAWEFPFADGDLASGDNAVTTTATDAAGNTSPASSPLTVTIDTANAAPSGLELTDATNSGSTGDNLTNIAAAEVTGTTEANAEVEVFVAGVSVGTTTADGDGNWSFTFADGDLSDGDNAVTVVSTDPAGNVSPSSETLTITLDETAPSVPSGLALTDATNSGITTDTITNVATAEVTGTTEANAEVEVFVAGISVGTTTADGDGNWSFTFTDGDLATGDNAVTATSTDAAGTTSNPSSPLTITLDDSASAAPSGIDLTDATNSGSNDDTLTNDTTSSIAGTAEPGAEVEVFVDGVSAGTVSADPTTGAWEFSFADSDLAEGDNVITTQATDVAGNTSPSSAPITVTIDTANAAPSGLALTDATNSGSTDDNLTNVAQAEVTGIAEVNAEVEVFVAGVTVGTTTADGDGNWSFTFANGDLATGDNAVTVVSNDTAGNTSPSSETLTITLDEDTPPTAPDVAVSDGSDSGEAGDGLTNDSTPEIGGTAEPGSEVEVFVGGISIGTASVDDGGNWSFTFDDGDLSEGDNEVTVAVTDPAGNTSATSVPQTITLDTIVPTATFTMPSEVQTGPFPASIIFSEPVDELTLAEILTENGTVSDLTTTDNVTFNFTVAPMSDGPVTLSIDEGVALDAAANLSAAASSAAVAADIVAPSMMISGPSAGVTETFQVTFEFTEDVTGFTIEDIIIAGGTLSNFQGSGSTYTVDVTPVVGQVVTLDVPAGMAQDAAGNDNEAAQTFSVQSGSPEFEFEQVKDEVTDIVLGIATRDLQNRIAANRQLVEDARTRFIGARQREEQCFTDERTGQVECPDGVGRRNTPLDITGDLSFGENQFSTRGSFLGQRSNTNGDVWRVISGNFNLSRDDDGATSALVTGRVAWERETSDDTLLAYYVGGDISRSKISGDFDGTADGYSLSLGSYFVSELRDDVFADGYASLGYGVANLDISNDTLGLQGEYSGLTFQTGASVTGVYEQQSFEFWPQLAVDYGYSDVGTVDFDAEAFGLVDQVSLDGGEVSIFKLSFEPEIKIAISGEVEGIASTTLTVTPKLSCQRVSGQTTQEDCGAGAGINLSSRSDDDLGRFDAGVSVEQIGDNTQTSLQLKLERRF